MTVFVLGYPADMGGANVELFATVRLWREHGVDVALIPVWRAHPIWRARLEALGCKTLIGVHDHPLLVMPEGHKAKIVLPKNAIVVAFANFHLLQLAEKLREQDCRLVYVPCMSTPCEEDEKFHGAGKQCDRYVFQSKYQHSQYTELLSEVPCARRHFIRGAFYPDDFPFLPLPHEPGEPFWAGRMSRPDIQKYSSRLWDAYRTVPKIRARIMAWSGTIGRHCGDPPEWATVLEKRSESAQDFYRQLHCIIHPTGSVYENWPRFVLEAMAAGVPVITDNRGGVREMIVDGVDGYLCSNPKEMAERACELSRREGLRLAIAKNARDSLRELADPALIWEGWERLFKEVS